MGRVWAGVENMMPDDQPIPPSRESGETLTECAERLDIPFWKAMEIARATLKLAEADD